MQYKGKGGGASGSIGSKHLTRTSELGGVKKQSSYAECMKVCRSNISQIQEVTSVRIGGENVINANVKSY